MKNGLEEITLHQSNTYSQQKIQGIIKSKEGKNITEV